MARTSKTRAKNKSDPKELNDKSVAIKKTRKTRVKKEPIVEPVIEKKTRKRVNPVVKDLPFGSEIVSNSRAPSVVSVPVSSGRGRKKSNKQSVDSKFFTQKEKKIFYECLKDNGISCLNDDGLLQGLFPNRSIIEIKAMIDGFTRKAQDLNRKNEYLESDTSEPNDSKVPIDKWIDIIHQMVPNPSKKDDISTIFVDLFEKFSALQTERQLEEPEADNSLQSKFKPDYQSVYECIGNAMNGKYAKQMEPINAFIVVKLIEELKQLIKSDLNKNEISFLKSGIWWQIPRQTNSQKSVEEIFKDIYSQRQQNNNQTEEDNVYFNYRPLEYDVQNGNASNESTDEPLAKPNEDSIYENLKTYPKLRKITECLNPLRIPVELINNQLNG